MARGERTSAGARPLRPADPQRGTNRSGVRLYHERLVLSLVRRRGSLPKAEIARLTGLSAQTVSVIVRQLEADGLLARGTPRRGKVGQPLVPFSLNPDGAFSIGLKLGRRSADLMLLDFTGKARGSLHETYPFPTPERVFGFLTQGLAALAGGMSALHADRIAGLGIAAPFELWKWQEVTGAPPGALEAWREFDIKAEAARLCPWPVQLCNDATAACAAELVYGKGEDYRDHVYFFIGFFVGGGVVINGHLHPGLTGNAGALGSMPVPLPGGGARQLIRCASIAGLESRLKARGQDWSGSLATPERWSEAGADLAEWIDEAALALAHAIAAAIAVIDFAAAVIDGAFPPEVRALMVAAVRDKMAGIDLDGLSPVEIVEGTIGPQARAIGGASLPLLANFALDRDILFKEAS